MVVASDDDSVRCVQFPDRHVQKIGVEAGQGSRAEAVDDDPLDPTETVARQFVAGAAVEAERVSVRIGVGAVGDLVLELGGTELSCTLFGFVQVVDRDVEMHLLRGSPGRASAVADS